MRLTANGQQQPVVVEIASVREPDTMRLRIDSLTETPAAIDRCGIAFLGMENIMGGSVASVSTALDSGGRSYGPPGLVADQQDAAVEACLSHADGGPAAGLPGSNDDVSGHASAARSCHASAQRQRAPCRVTRRRSSRWCSEPFQSYLRPPGLLGRRSARRSAARWRGNLLTECRRHRPAQSCWRHAGRDRPRCGKEWRRDRAGATQWLCTWRRRSGILLRRQQPGALSITCCAAAKVCRTAEPGGTGSNAWDQFSAWPIALNIARQF